MADERLRRTNTAAATPAANATGGAAAAKAGRPPAGSRAAPSAPARTGPDPLVELARLIGQNETPAYEPPPSPSDRTRLDRRMTDASAPARAASALQSRTADRPADRGGAHERFADQRYDGYAEPKSAASSPASSESPQTSRPRVDELRVRPAAPAPLRSRLDELRASHRPAAPAAASDSAKPAAAETAGWRPPRTRARPLEPEADSTALRDSAGEGTFAPPPRPAAQRPLAPRQPEPRAPAPRASEPRSLDSRVAEPPPFPPRAAPAFEPAPPSEAGHRHAPVRARDDVRRYEPAADGAYEAGESYDDSRFAAGPAPVPASGGYAAEDAGYAADGYAYDETENAVEHGARRRTLWIAAAILALAVVGTAGAYGINTLFSGTRDETPPVIRADSAPRKLAAGPQGGPDKQLHDRVGERSPGERIVLREEQPGAPGFLPGAAAGSAEPPMVGAPATTPPNGARAPAAAPGGEPKKIKTVTIRPEGQGEPQTPAAPARTAPAAAAPVPTAAAPARPVRPATPATGGEPISIAPQPAPAAPPRTATVAPAESPRPSAPAASGGGYVVQLSAQKSQSEAEASFRAMQAKYPSVLNGRQSIIRRKDLGPKGVYFAAQVGPFTSQSEASQLCESLKAIGGACLVQRN